MLERRRTKRSSKMVRSSMLLVFGGLLVMVLVVYRFYGNIYETNVSLDQDHVIHYIASTSDFSDVMKGLEEAKILMKTASFRWVAAKKGYDTAVKPGRFKIRNGISNNELVNLLRSGNQDPVMVVFNNVRSLEQVAGKVSRYLELDSAILSEYLCDSGLPEEYGLEKHNFSTMFIPDTYEFFWTTTPEEFCKRMASEYKKFWGGERDRKAGKMGMSRTEIVTLASIVDEETLLNDENSTVAGLYINRLRKGIPLQADPTLKFAMGDFTVKRILNEDKKIDSPYNTYKYRGLPPGPISIPSVSAIDGVLNFEKNSYLYMCVKADFSGHHAFAKTLSQHNENARKYHRELNKRRIYR